MSRYLKTSSPSKKYRERINQNKSKFDDLTLKTKFQTTPDRNQENSKERIKNIIDIECLDVTPTFVLPKI